MSRLMVKLAVITVGALLLTTSPAAASYSVSEDSSEPARVAAQRSGTAPGQAPTPAPLPGNVGLSIPRVAFAADVRVIDGRLRAPVLVNIAAAPGVARVTGARGACVQRLTPGEVAWIDCAVRSRGTVVIVVTLRDGTVATRVVRH